MTRLTTAKAMVVMTFLAAPAMAGDFGFSFNFAKGGKHDNGIGIGLRFGNVGVQPIRLTRLPVAYTTVTERVWVPTTETVYRDVPVKDAWGKVVEYRREATVVQGGYWQTVERQVPVRPAGLAIGVALGSGPDRPPMMHGHADHGGPRPHH